MACFEEAQGAILDKAFLKVAYGRSTFTRIGRDTIQINGKTDDITTKANSREQARAIAKQLSFTIDKAFNGWVKGFIVDEPNNPIKLKLIVKDAYVQHEVENAANKERDYVNNNSGPNTNASLFAPVQPALGVYAKYVQFKNNQLSEYKKRLARINAKEKDAKVTTAELVKLKKLKAEVNLLIDGSKELNIKGIKQEIEELTKTSNVAAVASYIEKDLDRLDKLSNSDNLDELNEGKALVDFYTLAGRFEKDMTVDGNPVSNPFFSKDEMFIPDQNGNLTNQYAVDDATREQFSKWRDRAIASSILITDKFKQYLVDTVNSDPSIIKTFGTPNFTYEQLTNEDTGLKDADWISMWTMDITHGTFSHNGLLPQVLYSGLFNEYNKSLVKVKKYYEEIDAINPQVVERLKELNKTLASRGIVGIKGISYQIFKEVTKDGNETTGLIQRFTKEYADQAARARYVFNQKFKAANNSVEYNKTFENFKKWRRDNSIILDITRIPEIANEIEFAEFNAVGNLAYRQKLIDVLGDKGYNEHIASQMKALRSYQSEKQSMIETLLVMTGKATYNDLSTADKNKIEAWDITHNPLKGYDDYNNVSGIYFGTAKTNNFMSYNVFVPRKYRANMVANLATDKYEITDTTVPTRHYNETFAEIEKDAVLSKFYDLVVEGTNAIREAMPPEIQEKIPSHTILSMNKSSAEIALDKNTNILKNLFPAFKDLWDKLRTSFGVNKQSELSYANIDPITGKPNYTINDSFFRDNTTQIKQLMLIEKTKFIQAYNSNITNPSKKLTEIKRFTLKNLSDFNVPSLVMLAQYLHVDITQAEIRAGQIDKIKNKLIKHIDLQGNVSYIAEIGKYIRDYSIHTMVQSQSFDLAKLMKYYYNLAHIYSAKQKALPTLEIVKKFYQQIQKPDTNNLGTQMIHVPNNENMKDGIRTRGNAQLENWFNRVILGHTGTKHFGEFSILGEKGLIGKRIYSNEERKKYNELTELINKEANPDTQKELQDLKNNLGKVRTATAIIDNFLEWIKILRLGYSLSSMSTNFIEGLVSNLMLSSTDQYFDPKELYFGYSTTKHSFLKNITFGKAESQTAKKVRIFMDRHNVIIDSSNENQRSSHKTFSDKMSWLNPHAGNQRTEFVNQAPLMIAMLRTIKIKDVNGNESSVWNASNPDTTLKSEFRTPDNIENWEELTGDTYLAYKQKLEDIITKGHGNYSELRGMMAKSESAGKAVMMFKTWIPQQLFWRFAVEQPDIATGNRTFKGTYRSHNKGSALLHGAAVGTALFGLPGTIGGSIFGLVLGTQGTDAGIGVLKETIESARLLFKKCLGMPVNVLAGRQLINVNKKTIFGKGEYFDWKNTSKFTEQDANNLRNNMTDIAVQLVFIAAILLVKGIFWDDDDDKDDAERIAHNVLVNKLMQLSGQASAYVNPKDLYHSTVGSMAVMQYLEDLGKWINRFDKALEGKDIIAGGINSGESGLWNQTKKIAMPGIFKDGNPAISLLKGNFPALGFGSQADKQFLPTPFDDDFKSEATLDKEENKADRAEERKTLMEEYKKDYPDESTRKKEVMKKLNKDLPTPAKLKKLGVTREEYEKQQLGQ